MSSVIAQASDSVPRYFTLPDFIATFPFNLRVNPHYQNHARPSYEWLDSFGVHPNVKHRDAFQAMDFALLTAMCYPDADGKQFRILCDYINALFAFDDLTDEGALRKDGDGTRKASDIVMKALHDPKAFKTPFKVGNVFSRYFDCYFKPRCLSLILMYEAWVYSFWGRALDLGVSQGCQRRFIETTDLYVCAVHEQVMNRAENKILDIEDFIELRRDTGALKVRSSRTDRHDPILTSLSY